MLALAPAAAATVEMPVVGAIRWDAYFSQPGMPEYNDHNAGIVARTTTLDMSPAKWHYRLPFFGKEVNNTSIVVNGNTPEAMGKELDYAAQHGIKFWSFCNYPIGCKDYHPPDSDCEGIQCCADNVGLSYAWNLYLNHPDNHKVNFTLLLQPGYWFPTALKGGNETLAQEIDRYISYFKMPNYQKVLGGRPVVFLFGGQANSSDLTALRAATKKALGVEPYITSMNKQKLPGLIDAASAYGTGGGKPEGTPYETCIAKPEANNWGQWAKDGWKVIPTVSAGWDNRPRGDGMCPWMKPVPIDKIGYCVDPTMQELEDHTLSGLKWVQDNSGAGGAAETNMMLLSAWNEHDEGHWIEPALDKYGGTEKLEAIARALSKADARAASLNQQQE